MSIPFRVNDDIVRNWFAAKGMVGNINEMEAAYFAGKIGGTIQPGSDLNNIVYNYLLPLGPPPSANGNPSFAENLDGFFMTKMVLLDPLAAQIAFFNNTALDFS